MNSKTSQSIAISFAPKTQGASPNEVGGYFNLETLCERLAGVATEEERHELRRQIIVGCLPLADRIAYRFVGRGEPSDDLIQVARIGLIKAVDRYDHEKGNFRSFAFTIIVGELRRHFRDTAWCMHVPRGIKDTRRRVSATVEPLSQRLGRAPTASELAAELDVGREAISISLAAGSAYRPASLDARVRASDSADEDLGSRHGADDPCYNAVEDRMALAWSMTKLPHHQQKMLEMRFYECLTQAQIAQYFGISQVHVSRLLTAALARLRAQLSETPNQAGEPAWRA